MVLPLSWWCHPQGKYFLIASGNSCSDNMLSMLCFFRHVSDRDKFSLAFSILKSVARKNRNNVVSLGN